MDRLEAHWLAKNTEIAYSFEKNVYASPHKSKFLCRQMDFHVIRVCAVMLFVLTFKVHCVTYISYSTYTQRRTFKTAYTSDLIETKTGLIYSDPPGLRIYCGVRKLELHAGDTVDIYDGDSDTGTLIMTLTDGDNTLEFISPGDKLYLVFTAHEKVLGQTTGTVDGVRLYIFSIDPDERHFPVGSANLNDAPTLLATEGSLSMLMSPNLQTYEKFSKNEHHFWMIKSPCVSYRLKLNYWFGSMKNCDSETSASTYVYDGPSTSDPYIFAGDNVKGYCQQYLNGPQYEAYASGQFALVFFYSNLSSVNNLRYGFMLTYQVEGYHFSNAGNVTEGCPSFLTAFCPFTAEIHFTAATYMPKTVCTMLIAAEDNNFRVALDFTSFDLEAKSVQGYCVYDQLRVYDGNTVNDSLLLNSFCGSDIPTNVTSSGQYILLQFTSDYSIEHSGFQVSYSLINASDAVCIDGVVESIATNAAQNLTSPGYPSAYENNLDEYWLISNPENATYSLVINIVDINIESSSNCKFDRIVIYSGKCPKSSIVDIYCESRPARFEYSSAEYRLVRFHTDYSNVGKGFKMQYLYEEFPTTSTTAVTTTTAGPQVSRVVDLVEDLVNTSDYYSDQHPMKYVPLPVPTTIDFYLVAIHGLDEIQGKLRTTGYFHVTWLDENLAWETDKQSSISKVLVPQDLIWKPDITLLNGFLGFIEMGSSFMYCTIRANGTVSWKPFQVLESSCNINILQYPYDEQTCRLKFKAWTGTSVSAINTTRGSQGIKLAEGFTSNRGQWMLQDYTSSLTSDGINSILTYTLTLRRNGNQQIRQQILPVVFIAITNLSVFILQPKKTGNAKFALMMLIVNIFYYITEVRSLPKNSSNISIFGLYMSGVMVISAGIILTQFLIHRIALKNPDRRMVPIVVQRVTRLTLKSRAIITCQSQSSVGQHSPFASWGEVSLALEFVCGLSFAVVTVLITIFFLISI